MKQHSPAEIITITGGTKFDRGADQSGKPLQMFWRVDKENTFDINGYTLTSDPGQPMEFCDGYLRSVMIKGAFPYRILDQDVIFTRRPSRSGGHGHTFFDLYFNDEKGNIQSGHLKSTLTVGIKGKEYSFTGHIHLSTDTGTLGGGHLATPFHFDNSQFELDLEPGDSIGFYPDGTVSSFSFSKERRDSIHKEWSYKDYYIEVSGVLMDLKDGAYFHESGNLKEGKAKHDSSYTFADGKERQLSSQFNMQFHETGQLKSGCLYDPDFPGIMGHANLSNFEKNRHYKFRLTPEGKFIQ